jgi:hypothetical protein
VPGPLLTVSAQVMCLHGGTAKPLAPDPRVTVSGQPVVTVMSPWVIAGCPFPPIAGGPCVTGMFIVPAIRVMVDGAPVLLLDSQGICAPTGVPLLPIASAAPVIGS